MTLQELAKVIAEKATENPGKEVCVLIAGAPDGDMVLARWNGMSPKATKAASNFLKLL